MCGFMLVPGLKAVPTQFTLFFLLAPLVASLNNKAREMSVVSLLPCPQEYSGVVLSNATTSAAAHPLVAQPKKVWKESLPSA